MALEDVAGLERPAGARRPAGDADVLLPQRHQELLALDARDAQVQVAREHLDAGGGRRPCGRRPRPRRAARRAGGRASAATRGPAVARSAATRRSAVASPTAPATSWVPLRRSRSCPPPYWRGSRTTRPATASAPDADGTPDLVRAERDHVGAGGDLGQVEVGRGLHGVGEHVRVGGAAVDRLYEVGQRLDHARLVVGRHDGHARHPRRQRAGQRVGVDDAGGVDGELTGIEAGFGRGPGRLAHGRVLDGGIEEHRLTPLLAGRLGGPQKGQVGRLGAAGGEDDVAGVAAEEGGHLVAGLLEQATGPLGRRVAAGGIAEDGAGRAPPPWPRHLGPQRRGGGVIEIGQ